MSYYIMAFLLSIFFMNRYTVTNEKKYIIFSLLPIIILSGFRYDVGTDYMFRYFPDFKSIESGIIPYNLELGFLMMVKMCLLISKNFQLVMMITSIFIYGLLYYIIAKRSVKPELSILILLIGGFYFDSLNIVRQYMAIMLLMLCFYKIIDDRVKESVIYLGLAMTLHNSVLIFVVIFVPYILKYNKKYIQAVLLAGLVVTPLFKPVMKVLLSGTRFSVYFEGELSYYTQGDFQVILCVLNIMVLLIYTYCIYKEKNILEERISIMYFYCQAVALILNVFSGFMFIAFRFTYMFSIFQILGVPYMLDQLDSSKEKTLIIRGIVAVYIIAMLYLVVLQGTNEVLPYSMKLFVN